MVQIALETQQKQTARKMLARGYDPAEISELTGLSAEEVAALSDDTS